MVTYNVKLGLMHNSCRVKLDHCVRFVKGVCYHYITGNPMLPVVGELRRVERTETVARVRVRNLDNMLAW